MAAAKPLLLLFSSDVKMKYILKKSHTHWKIFQISTNYVKMSLD